MKRGVVWAQVNGIRIDSWWPGLVFDSWEAAHNDGLDVSKEVDRTDIKVGEGILFLIGINKFASVSGNEVTPFVGNMNSKVNDTLPGLQRSKEAELQFWSAVIEASLLAGGRALQCLRFLLPDHLKHISPAALSSSVLSTFEDGDKENQGTSQLTNRGIKRVTAADEDVIVSGVGVKRQKAGGGVAPATPSTNPSYGALASPSAGSGSNFSGSVVATPAPASGKNTTATPTVGCDTAAAAAVAGSSASAPVTTSSRRGGVTGGKRLDYLSWDDYFLSVAQLTAMRSKDPQTQVGACIVSQDKKIVGIGYNGFPNGCDDDELPWGRGSGVMDLGSKYPYVCHAEMNAIMNKNSADTVGCSIYVALFPCNDCAKLIIQSGIVEVIYVSDKYHNTPSAEASRRMFDLAKVRYRQLNPSKRALQINFPTDK